MKPKPTTPRLLLLLPWLSLPLVAAAHLLLWDRLPEHLAVHFDIRGAPTGWMTRGQSLAFDLSMLFVVLLLSTLELRRKTARERHSGLLILNVVALLITLVFVGLVKYNATGSLF